MAYNLNDIEQAARTDSQAHGYASNGSSYSADGKLQCFVVPAQSASGFSYRATWYYEGKRIKRAYAETL